MSKDSVKGFGVLADDLTGAMDAGAGFLGMGLHPFIKLRGTPPPDSSAIVISTDSRDKDPETAHRIARRKARELAELCVYKKIDSTLRGNIGQEITGVMEALRFEKAVVCPAFPANGRAVVEGNLLLGNISMNEAYGKDPDYPVTGASIPALLQKQTDLRVGTIDLEEVSKGSDNVFRKIRASEQKVIVVDATEEKHLRCIAQALFMSVGKWLPCGSGGLARELPAAFGYKPLAEKPFERTVSMKPVLAIVGSRNPVSLRQIRTAEACSSIHVITFAPDNFIDDGGKLTGLGTLTKEVFDFMNSGKSVLITTSLSRYVPGLRETTARLLARIAAGIVQRCELAGLFLTGGDIARETCRSLGAGGIRILKELEPGVILGEATGTTTGDARIITKAGGFGSDRAIVDAIRYLKGAEG